MKNLCRKKVRARIVILGLAILCSGCASEPVVKQEGSPLAPAVPTAKEPLVTASAKPTTPVVLPKAGPLEKVPLREVSCVVHTVKWRGETMSMIAAWYTGKSTNWKALTEFNPEINPGRIFAGNAIRIPEGMLKTRDPMPKEYVERFYKSGKNQNPIKTATSQPNEDELALFGPKASPGK